MPTSQEIVAAVSKQLQGQDLSQQAVMVMQKATAKVLDRCKQNIDVQLKEDSAPVVEEFVRNVAQKLLASTQSWVSGAKNDLTIFPEGTRFIFRDGPYTTVVVEQQPQVRSLRVQGDRHFLALPYVQFIIPLNGGKALGTLAVTCTKKPLRTMEDALYHLPLPNVDNHSVCLGSAKWNVGGDLTSVVNGIIGAFWQSDFTDDHRRQYNQFLTDSDLRSPEQWESKSKSDPLFMVDQKSGLCPSDRSLRGLLAHAPAGVDGVATLVNQLKAEILQAVGTVGGDIKSLLTNMDLKTENRERVHVDTFQGVLKEIIVQAYAELWEHLQGQLNAERDKYKAELQAAAKKLSTELLTVVQRKEVPR